MDTGLSGWDEGEPNWNQIGHIYWDFLRIAVRIFWVRKLVLITDIKIYQMVQIWPNLGTIWGPWMKQSNRGVRFGPKVGQIRPISTNPGFAEPRRTESWFEEVPDLSYLVSILSTTHCDLQKSEIDTIKWRLGRDLLSK